MCSIACNALECEQQQNALQQLSMPIRVRQHAELAQALFTEHTQQQQHSQKEQRQHPQLPVVPTSQSAPT